MHAAVSKEARDALRGGRGILAAAIALLLFAPNVVWNAEHGFPTVRHTETNIGWQYPYIHPLRLVEYVIVQFAVFGPILMTVLLRTIWRELPKPSDPRKVLLLSFSLPVLGLLVFQALLSRAHGNWSATAYPAASILVTAVMLELNRETLFRVSLALHLAFAVVVPASLAKAFGQMTDLGSERVTLVAVKSRELHLPSRRLQRRPAGALSVATDWRWSSPGHSHLPARRRRRSRHWRIRA